MSVYEGFACIKSVLFILNVLFVLSGCIVLILGICVNTYFSSYDVFVDERYQYAPEFLILLGAVIILISVLGCYGTFTEDPCVTLMFSTFLILIFIIELAIGITGYVMKEKAQTSLVNRFNNALTDYNKQEIRDAWDDIQATFDCCGINGPSDWAHNNWTIPVSCCNFPKNGPLLDAPCGNLDLHHSGCLNVFVDFVKINSRFIQAIGLSLAFMQLTGVMCSCYLSYIYRKGYESI